MAWTTPWTIAFLLITLQSLHDSVAFRSADESRLVSAARVHYRAPHAAAEGVARRGYAAVARQTPQQPQHPSGSGRAHATTPGASRDG